MARSNWIGETLGGRYEIVELLGQGGMSAVYKANDPNLRRVVALKLIHAHLSSDPEFVRRFEEEAASVAQLRHPNLIQVFDFNNDEDVYYIVFEFVPGETLQDRLKRLHDSGRQMDIEETADIVTQTANGLHYAHTKGLVHRDIKPANIMVNIQNSPIVMDFGIAKIMGGTQHTATGAVLGTARYMSPEQIKGEPIDPRTDIYSLGVTMFEMLGGRPPFNADSAMTVMMMHMTDPVPDLRDLRADIPAGLVAVVNKAMAKDPDDRFQSAAEFAAALHDMDLSAAPLVPEMSSSQEPDPDSTVVEPVVAAAALADTGSGAVQAEGSSAPPSTPAAQTSGPAASSSGSRSWLYIAGGALALILLLAGIWAIFLRDDGGAEEQPAVAVVETETAESGSAAAEAAAAPIEEAAEESVEQPTEEPLEEPTEEPLEEPTEEPTREPTAESAQFEPLPVAASFSSTEGEVTVISDGEESSATSDTVLTAGSQVITGENSAVEFTLEDGTVFQLGESTALDIRELADDPGDPTLESIFSMSAGDILLRQPQPGNILVLLDGEDNLLGSLQAAAASSALLPGQTFVSKPARAMARNLVQETVEGALMAINLDQESGQIVRISCFAGLCTLGDSFIIPVGEEVVVDRVERVVLAQEPITPDSASVAYWQEACAACLPEAIGAVAEAAFATATIDPAAEEPIAPPAPDPTATTTAAEEPIAPPAPDPTATAEETAEELYVSITGITVDNGGYYSVSYETTGYTEQLPGQHVHFFFDTVPEAQAGVPGSGPWILYGGPRPFREYTEFDRPEAATAMCARVANADHSIIYGSGNCYPLP